MKEEEPLYEKERMRTKDDKLVLCQKFEGFYSKNYFSRHRSKCVEDLAEEPRAVPVQLLFGCTSEVTDAFKVVNSLDLPMMKLEISAKLIHH